MTSRRAEAIKADDSQAIRGFVGIDLNRESAPDATTLLKFRHLLENTRVAS